MSDPRAPRAPSWTPTRSTRRAAFAGIEHGARDDRRACAGGKRITVPRRLRRRRGLLYGGARARAAAAGRGCRLVSARSRIRRIRTEPRHRQAAGGAGHEAAVTADCAITAVEEVAAREGAGDGRGRHRPSRVRADGALPACSDRASGACAATPFRELCATAVAYKLAEGVAARSAAATPVSSRGSRSGGACDDRRRGAAARREPLARTARSAGALRHRQARAARADGRRASRSRRRVDERSVAFGLAPRLNAAGRLYRADAGLELILTEDPLARRRSPTSSTASTTSAARAERTISFEAEAQIAALGD